MIIMNFNFIFYIGLFYLTSDNWGKGILPPSLLRPPDKDLCWKVVRYGYWRLIVVAFAFGPYKVDINIINIVKLRLPDYLNLPE